MGTARQGVLAAVRLSLLDSPPCRPGPSASPPSNKKKQHIADRIVRQRDLELFDLPPNKEENADGNPG